MLIQRHLQMTMDADVMLTDDVRAALGRYYIGADVFSLFEWSSQVSLQSAACHQRMRPCSR